MRRLACLAAALACLAACTPPVRDPAADAAPVRALVHDRLAAALEGDTARWHRQVSDACLWTGPALRNETTAGVLASIAANRVLKPAAQEIRDLDVRVSGDVAQATYVQLVQDGSQAAEAGKRFRKTDTYQRQRGAWRLIGAAEVAVPYRPRMQPGAAVVEAIAGRYVFGGADTLTVLAASPGRFLLRGQDGITDTLLAENDSTLFVEGDPGSWVFRRAAAGPVLALIYRAEGGKDVVLPRVR